MVPRLFRTVGSVVCLSSLVSADVSIIYDSKEYDQLVKTSNGHPTQSFRSSDIIAPVLEVNTWNKSHVDPAPYILLGTTYGNETAGPTILDSKDLSLVYADQRYNNTYFADVQQLNGTNYLTFWEGDHTRKHAKGNCLIFDDKYHLKYNVTAQGQPGIRADMHEMRLTKQGTILFSTYLDTPHNCSSVGGPEKALLMDSGFQELNLETNEVVFEWFASKHFDVADTLAKYSEEYGVGPDSGFDFFHINAIEKTDDGNYLISSRHLSLLVLISGTDGTPIWILGGKKNQFKDLSGGNATNFGWQHDARFHNGQSEITMFDNHGEATDSCGDQPCKSRGLHLAIDANAMTVRVVQEYFHPEHVNSGAMGSFQALENGNAMVSWGYNPSFTEYNKDGEVVMDVQRGQIGKGFKDDMFTYRVNKRQWKGFPTWPPSIAVDAPNRTTLNASVFVSWNGATEVATWAVLASDNDTTVSYYKNVIAESNRTGFETEIKLGQNYTRRYIGAAAIAADGSVLGSTYVMDMETGQPVILPSGITSIKRPAKVASAAAGVMGGGIFGVSMLFYAVNYFWKRKPAVVQELAEYSKVGAQV